MGRLFIIITIGALALLLTTSGSGLFSDLSGDDIAALVSLTLVGTLVMSGFASGRLRISTLIRQALLWACIFIGLIVSYEFRFELKDMTTRVTADIFPGAPVSIIDSNGNISVELRRTGSSFRTTGSVNGEETSFIVDTGATTVVLTTKTASLAGIDVDQLQFIIPVATANGMTNAARAELASISIGGIQRSDLTVLVAAKGTLFDNLLGLTFLDTLSGYDVRGRRLVLRN